MVKIAVYNHFCAAAEIRSTLALMNVDFIPFRDDVELRSILQNETVDFVFSINFFEKIHYACIDLDVPYAAWSFDYSYAFAHELWVDKLRGGKDFLFLYHKKDFRHYSSIHKDTWYLPFSAADFFIRPVKKNSWDFKMLALMNSYDLYSRQNRDTLEKVMGRMKNEQQEKIFELIKSIMNLIVEKHTPVCDRNMVHEYMNELIAACGVDPFFGNEHRKKLCCNLTYLILTPVQRRKCIEELCSANLELDVFGDESWKEILEPFSSALVHPNLEYADLSSHYNSSMISLNLTQIQNIEAVPQRIYHILASGGFALTNGSEAVGELFKSSVHLETFGSFEEMKDKSSYYLKNDDARNKIASAGQAEFIKNHKMDLRFSFMIDKVMRGIKKDCSDVRVH